MYISEDSYWTRFLLMVSSIISGNTCLLLFTCNVSNKPGWPSLVCTDTLLGSSEKQKCKIDISF